MVDERSMKWLNSWTMAAEKILAALLFDVSLFDTASGEYNLRADHFPAALAKVWQAITRLIIEDRPINETALIDVDHTISIVDLAKLYQLYDETCRIDFAESCKIVFARGQGNIASNVLNQAARAIHNGENVQTVAYEAADKLYSLDGGQRLAVTADALGAEFQAGLGKPLSFRAIDLGHAWLNAVVPFFHEGQLMYIAAPYKMRKSTLLRNMLIGALRAGASVTVFQLEDNVAQLRAQLIAMLGAEWLIKEGHWHTKGKLTPLSASEDCLRHFMTADTLTLFGEAYNEWHPIFKAAVNAGISEFTAWGKRLRLYDKTPERGMITNLLDVKAKLRHDRLLYGLDVAAVDYLNLLDAPGDGIFDRTEYRVFQLQETALRLHTGLIVLAQQNEEGVKSSAYVKNKQHSPNIKGGGDAPSSASYLFLTEYGEHTQSEDLNHLWANLHLSRHQAAGTAARKRRIPMHPASGLLLDDTIAAHKAIINQLF